MRCLHRERIERLLDRILIEKEKLDIKHTKESAPHGCHCRRCKNARILLDTLKK